MGPQEAERLKALEALDILDTEPEPAFDSITRLGSQLLDVPICLISLVDQTRQWFKSHHGLDDRETHRDLAFCAHAIQNTGPFIVSDTHQDDRFKDNALVTGAPFIRSYAGIPLSVADHQKIGTICAIDTKPRDFTECELAALKDLACMVVELLELRRTGNTLKESEQRFRDVTDKIPDAIFHYQLHPDGTDSIEFLSDACIDLWEFSGEQLDADPSAIWGLTHPDDLPAMQESVAASAENLTLWSHRYRITTPSGTLKWVHGRGTPTRLKDGTVAWNTVASDISESVRRERELSQTVSDLRSAKLAAEYQAYHDSLTGLPNRRFLDRELNQIETNAGSKSAVHQMLHIDIDRFKEINDTLGHAFGDQVISVVARKLQECVRKTDVVSRVGGDEFIVLCRNCDNDSEVNQVATRILASTKQPVTLGEHSCRLSVSIGVARASSENVERLLTDSDIALYEAKGAGRSRWVRFTHAMRADFVSRKFLADDIARGLEAGEFIPVFQPQFDAQTSECVGVEALARWQHPYRGLLTPFDFLEVASSIGLDKQIDVAIFRKSMKIATYFNEIGLNIPKVSVNVSLRRLLDKNLRDEIRRHKPENVRVALELLETVHFDDSDTSVYDSLELLRESGVSIEIDDFGSGHASITALKRIQPEILKIDRELIMPIAESDEALELVKSIVEIARCLKIAVTAEGVETLEQLTALRRIGVQVAQGYYLARPMKAEQLIEFMQAQLNTEHKKLAAG